LIPSGGSLRYLAEQVDNSRTATDPKHQGRVSDVPAATVEGLEGSQWLRADADGHIRETPACAGAFIVRRAFNR